MIYFFKQPQAPVFLPGRYRLTAGHLCPTMRSMKGKEFIKRIRELAKEKGLQCKVDEKRGKGSHITLYYGDKKTVVRNPKDELKTGTLEAMKKQLGVKEDF